MTIFLSSLGFGLVTASVLAIASVGFTLQFGVTDVLNLAYGAIMIAGAFVAYVVNQAGLSVWVGLVAAVIVCSLGSVAAELRGLHAVPAARHLPDHDGHRLARDDPHHRVRRPGGGGRDRASPTP